MWNRNDFSNFRAQTIITDLAEFVPLMQTNIDVNKKLFEMNIEARELKWGCDVSTEDCYKDLDVVIVADCIYYEEVCIKSRIDFKTKNWHLSEKSSSPRLTSVFIKGLKNLLPSLSPCAFVCRSKSQDF